MALVFAFSPMSEAATCPAEVGQAKEMLSKKGSAANVQAPRSLAGARQDLQAPRGQDLQAPRGQDLQAPRGQDLQAPRGQDLQAPRSGDQSPRAGGSSKVTSSTQASQFVKEAEAACKAGDMKTATEKAEAAITIL